jgi:hypothetical protein
MHSPQASAALPRASSLLLTVLLLAVVSCSSSENDRKSVYPVRGKVFYKNKPAYKAFVTFKPVNEPATPKDPRPHGEVEKDGSFSLSTFGDKDGAPAGEYLVLITWPRIVDDREEGDQLEGRYNNDKNPQLPRVTVAKEPNNLQPFHLK